MKAQCIALSVSLLALGPVLPATAQSVGPEIVPDFFAAPAESAPPPLRLAESLAPQPETSLRAAEVGARDALEALQAWNRAGHLPLRAGLVRTLPSRVKARTGVSPAGNRVWGMRVDVEGAQRLRLHLTQVSLPAGSRLWIYAPGEEARAFGLDLLGPAGDLWTPSVTGSVAFLEVEAPANAALPADSGFTVEEIMEGVLAPPAPLRIAECLIDGTCVSSATLANIADYRKAVGQLDFVIAPFEYLCSGALVNDTDSSTMIPYFLTANHCIDSQSIASTLEVFWDYKTASCDGSTPGLGSLPRSNGATLIATGESSDFTLLRLTSIPSGRVLLGWNANTSAVPNGTTLYRLSHPAPFDDEYALPQQFSRGMVRTSGVPFCSDAPRPDFLYSQLNQGGTFGGSSGSPVVLSNLQIVGQLTGGCGDNPDDGCDYGNSEIDGAFSASYPSLQAFLSPTTGSGSCTPGADTLCLNNGRFRVKATFNASGAQPANAQVVKLTDETGYLWFFSAGNVEAVVKVLNACGLNNHYWVFAGGLTNVHTVITVTDTKTGAQKIYTNPQNTAFQPVQDTSAFATCP